MTPKLHVLYTVLSCTPGRRHTIFPSPPVLMKTKACTPVLRGTLGLSPAPFLAGYLPTVPTVILLLSLWSLAVGLSIGVTEALQEPVDSPGTTNGQEVDESLLKYSAVLHRPLDSGSVWDWRWGCAWGNGGLLCFPY